MNSKAEKIPTKIEIEKSLTEKSGNWHQSA
jgi:hypothetical protein